MAQADKPDSSTGKAKSKTSYLDEDISKDFLGSWKTMSVTGGDDMDFNFEPVTKGKKKAFNFDMDMDFSLDDPFGKMPSFKLDMPDIDFSSSPKKSLKSMGKQSDEESAEGSRQEKNDKFTFSFDFNGDGNENGENKITMVVDAVPQGGQVKKDGLHLLKKGKTSIDSKSSGDDPIGEGNGKRLHDSPSSRGKELPKQDSAVEKRAKNADVSSAGDNNENGEIKSKMVAGAVPRDGHAEKDDNKKMSSGIKSSRNKEISFVEAFGKLPSLKLDMPVIRCYASPKKSSKFKEKLSEEESSKRSRQENSDKLSSAPPLTEKINASPISEEKEVAGVVETLGSDNFTLDTVACSATNISKSMNSKIASNAKMQISGLKDSPAPSDSEPTHMKQMSLDYQFSGANNVAIVRGPNDGAGTKLPMIKRNKTGSTPLESADSGGDLSSEQDGKNMDEISRSPAKELLKQKSHVEKRENNADVLRDGYNNENEEIRNNMVAYPVPRDGQAKKDGLHLFDNMKMSFDDKSSGNRLPSLIAPKEETKSVNQGYDNLKGNISSKSTVQKYNAGQVNRHPSTRTDNIMPTIPSLKISRDISPNKQSSSFTVQDPNHMGNLEKSPRQKVKAKMNSPAIVQKQTPSVSSLKRKPAEAADLHPSKRLSPSESRKFKVSAIEVENETQGTVSEESKKNVTAENLSPKLDFCQEANMENLGFTLMVEGDVNVEKAEACAKELDDICSMLKKKHDKAKELLVRALVNNNYLLLLNNPISEEKIRVVQRFALRLMSREQEAGV